MLLLQSLVLLHLLVLPRHLLFWVVLLLLVSDGVEALSRPLLEEIESLLKLFLFGL